MRGLEPFGPENRVWGRNLYTPNFQPSTTQDSIVSNFYIAKYLFHHFAYHETGALSMQSRDNIKRTSSRPFWKTVDKAPNQTASLKKFLQPYYPAFGYYVYLPKRNENDVQTTAYFVICENQTVEDAVDDFARRYSINSFEFLKQMCLILDGENLPVAYKCSEPYGNKSSNKFLGSFEIYFNDFIPHLVIVREGYDETFVAECACTFSSYCSDAIYDRISSSAKDIILKQKATPKIQAYNHPPIFSFPIWFSDSKTNAIMFSVYDINVPVKSQISLYCSSINIESFVCNQIIKHAEQLYQLYLPSLKMDNIREAQIECDLSNDCMSVVMPLDFNSFSFPFLKFNDSQVFSQIDEVCYLSAWETVFRGFGDFRNRLILEINSFEGLTTCMFMDYFCIEDSCQVFSVDAHERGKNGENIDDKRTLALFRNNTYSYGKVKPLFC